MTNKHISVFFQYTELQNVLEINPRPSRVLSSDTEVSFIPMKNVDEGTGKYDLSETRTYAQVKKGYTPFEDGDILFAKITPCMENKKIAVMKGLKNGVGFGSTEFHVLRPKKGIALADYYYYFLLQDKFINDAKTKMKGTAGQLRLPPEYLKTVNVPIPSLTEQRKIVETINLLSEKINISKQKITLAQSALKQFRRSVLQNAFSGRITNGRDGANITGVSVPQGEDNLPLDWRWVKLEQLLKDKKSLSYGILKPGEYDPEGVPMLRIMDVGHGKLNNTNIYKVDKKIASGYTRTTLRQDDLVIAIMGTIGRTMVVPKFLEGANVNRALAVIRLSPEVDPHYMCNLLMSPSVQEKFRKKTMGSAQQRINLDDLRSIVLPLPPLTKQHEIVDIIGRYSQMTDALESTITSTIHLTEQMESSIFHNALDGRLALAPLNDKQNEKRIESLMGRVIDPVQHNHYVENI